MESVLSEIARETAGRATVGLVYPEEQKLLQSFQVRVIPAIFLIRDAEVKRSYEGIVSKELLMKDLQEFGPVAAR
jgi:thioredoxin-like negative regulator of GroEL